MPGYAFDGLIACHACDGAHRIVPVPEGGKALCGRCGGLLYRNLPSSLDHSAALYLMFHQVADGKLSGYTVIRDLAGETAVQEAQWRPRVA